MVDELKKSEEVVGSKEVIAVVDSEPTVRTAIRGLLARAFPDFSILEEDSCLTLVKKLQDGTAGSVALIIAEADDVGLGVVVGNRGKASVVITLNNGETEMAGITSMLSKGDIAATLQKPFYPSGSFEATIEELLTARGDVLAQKRAEKREIFIGDFVKRYRVIIAESIKFLENLSSLRVGGDFVQDPIEDDLLTILEVLRKFEDHFVTLRGLAAEGKNLDPEKLRKPFHDMNNLLTSISMFAEAWLETAEGIEKGSPDFVEPEVVEFLTNLRLNLGIIMPREIKNMSQMNKSPGSWVEPQRGAEDSVSTGSLDVATLPQGEPDIAPEGDALKGKNICVVDDQANILTLAARSLSSEGAGRVFTAKTIVDLRELSGSGEKVEIILLDHSLDNRQDGIKGYTLIGEIRSLFPGVMIVCHSNEVDFLIADELKGKKPYGNEGVGIIAKADWVALKKIVASRG